MRPHRGPFIRDLKVHSMRLSHLEVVGFKSFSSKLKVEFSDGITAVVGPNGCGKSNIVDAIRWALGEHRATSLRGNRMEDIIFNGTATRKPLGMAEVSLTIDNNDQKLPIEYSEVTREVLGRLVERGAVQDGDRVLLTKGDLHGHSGGTNAMKIVTVGDFVEHVG